jgi:UDP-N-acetyl-D-glucosamine dehydrogenase
VPTPFTANKEPDISYIIQAAEAVGEHLRGDQCVILKSTTFPNTTEGYVQPILERRGSKAGTDFHLAFSPERIDPGNKVWHTANTPIVVGGVTPLCTQIAAAANRVIISKVVEVSSPKVAEMEKLLENIFRSVNIALVNELAQLCDRMGGISMWEVVEAAATKPFGFMPFFPGPGIGGHCILIDPYYLSWLAREYDFVTNFITLAAEVNESMPFYVQRMVLNQVAHLPVAIGDARILIFGVAFKRDVDDLRHSPALRVMELLTQEGANNISYIDPYIPTLELFGNRMEALPYSDELVREADVVVITTDHSDFDYERIVANAKVVIDTRNATKNVKEGRQKVYLLGGGQCIR